MAEFDMNKFRKDFANWEPPPLALLYGMQLVDELKEKFKTPGQCVEVMLYAIAEIIVLQKRDDVDNTFLRETIHQLLDKYINLHFNTKAEIQAEAKPECH